MRVAWSLALVPVAIVAWLGAASVLPIGDDETLGATAGFLVFLPMGLLAPAPLAMVGGLVAATLVLAAIDAAMGQECGSGCDDDLPPRLILYGGLVFAVIPAALGAAARLTWGWVRRRRSPR